MSSIKPEVLRGWGPGGWIFYQPETNWWAPLPLATTFDAQVANIIAMRQANPRFNLSTDPPSVAADLEAYTIARWSKKYSRNGMQRFLAGSATATMAEAKKKESSTIGFVRRASNAVAGLAGAGNPAPVEDWLGAGGKPVAVDEANRRAGICVNCTANRSNGWENFLSLRAGETIRAYLSLKNRMKLSTPQDDALGLCMACKCSLKLKVWCPMEFIQANQTGEDHEKLKAANAACWALEQPK